MKSGIYLRRWRGDKAGQASCLPRSRAGTSDEDFPPTSPAQAGKMPALLFCAKIFRNLWPVFLQ
jgi:hypothetical protein